MKKIIPLVFILATTLLPLGARASQDVYVVQFLLDGLRYDAIEAQIAAGKLPTLKEEFYDKAAVFQKAITTFPTVSSAGYAAFTTGLSSGNSGVFFLEWFDRTKRKPVGYLTSKGFDRVNEDIINRLSLYNTEQKKLYSPVTLFEQLAPETTAAVYSSVRRGATLQIPKKFPVAALYNGLMAKDGDALNRLAMKELNKIFSKKENLPRYTLVALYGTDYAGHKSGPNSEELAWDLQLFDAYFKKFLSRLDQLGIRDKTYLILNSDHGMHRTGKVLHVKDVLRAAGIRSDKIYASNRGVSSAFVYIAGEEGWKEFPTLDYMRNYPLKQKKNVRVDLVQTLYSHPAIGWVAARRGLDEVHLYTREGESIISQMRVGDETYYSYTSRGKDPLGYENQPSAQKYSNGKPHSATEWFAATIDTEFPNGTVEISNLFQDPKAGDILVSAAGEYGFRTAKAATHGGLQPGDMHVPLWIAGPTVKPGLYDKARTVDIYPTVLSWFGLENPETLKNQEGKLLFATAKAENAEKDVATDDRVNAVLADIERQLMYRPRLIKAVDPREYAEEIKKLYPKEMKAVLKKRVDEEVEARYARWKKFRSFQKSVGLKTNPLAVPKRSKESTEWLLSKEENLEFLRLRRMEDIQTILKNP